VVDFTTVVTPGQRHWRDNHEATADSANRIGDAMSTDDECEALSHPVVNPRASAAGWVFEDVGDINLDIMAVVTRTRSGPDVTCSSSAVEEGEPTGKHELDNATEGGITPVKRSVSSIV